jgi:LmbE family N-acetylglucosaminyl deacetylase
MLLASGPIQLRQRGRRRGSRLMTTLQQLGAWRDERPTLGVPAGPVLALSAHPDDESLAFGGTLARLAAADAGVHVVCVTAGESSLAGLGRTRLGRARLVELQLACEWLGITDVEYLAMPDGGLSTRVDQLAELLCRRISRLRPAVVLLPWWRDAHRDHRALSAALVAMSGPAQLQVWAGEIWSPLPATHVVDISGSPLVRKQAALTAYRSAARTLQLDAVLGLNRYRALAAGPDCEAAEAFVVATLPAYRELVATT